MICKEPFSPSEPGVQPGEVGSAPVKRGATVLRDPGHIRRSRRWGRGIVKPSIEVWATGFSFLAKRAILSEQITALDACSKIRYLPRRLNTPRRRVLPLDSASPQERVHRTDS